jgi:hypothetical protein
MIIGVFWMLWGRFFSIKIAPDFGHFRFENNQNPTVNSEK